MAVKTVERCLRCGTIMRNGRAFCPSCGWDPKAPPVEEVTAEATQGEKEKGPKKVVAKAGVKICPICTASAPEDQMVEFEGNKICPSCAENMRNKQAKKGPAPTPPQEKEKK
jgi:hypothetical protein